MRRQLGVRRKCRGFALMAILALVTAGTIYFLATWLGPDLLGTYRARKTEAALAEAREALLGYAATYRDRIDSSTVYGHLPLPDIGDARNNAGCALEGCDAGNYAGNGSDITVIGRFPWRLFGTEPLRDGYGECLWLVVSGGHKRLLPTSPMNWDTLGQIDIQVANGANSLASILTSAHGRPVAVVFSPGPRLANQNRGAGPDVVTQCGGNYDVANYLDPDTVGALAGVTNFFGGVTNNAFGDTSAGPKPMSLQGAVYRRNDATLWPNACPPGESCALAANDVGLALAPDELFGAIRKSSAFRTDINTMLDMMVACLRDQVAAGIGFAPQAIAGYVPPADKSAGRIHSDACFNALPPGYFNHWRDMFFVARPNPLAGYMTVNGDATCKGVVIFAGQRGAGQSRSDLAEQSALGNYLEGSNLSGFTAVGSNFSGPTLLDLVSATQSAQQDIVRCIPDSTSLLPVTSPTLTSLGFDQLVHYYPGSRTLVLGAENVTTGLGAPASALFGCAWTPEITTRGNGFRTYFTFRFKEVTGSVGNNGFVFAAIDGESNTPQVCGAGGSHLGYAGDNGTTPRLVSPKVAIEFDQGRNSGFSESSNLAASNPGKRDPCGTAPPPTCPANVGYNTHAAIAYWGHDVANVTDGVTRPNDDDNVHGYPSSGSQSSNPRPVPQNPNDFSASPPGIVLVNLRGQSGQDVDGDGDEDSFLYHVRVEFTKNAPAHQAADALVASGLNVSLASPGASIDGQALAIGNRVLLMAQSSSAQNGIYIWNGASTAMARATDADTIDELNDAFVVVAQGTHAGNWRQTATIAVVNADAQNWQPEVDLFSTKAWIVRDSDTTAQIRAAMQDTTRSMAQLYPGYSATLSDVAAFPGPGGGACGGGCPANQTCGSDNICYRPAMKSLLLGFTGSQRTQDQIVLINNFYASWLP